MAKFYAVYLFAADLQAFRSVSDEIAAIVLIPPPGIGSVLPDDRLGLRQGCTPSSPGMAHIPGGGHWHGREVCQKGKPAERLAVCRAVPRFSMRLV